MTETDYPAFRELWTLVREGYERGPLSNEALRMEFAALGGHDLQEIGQAVLAHKRDPVNGKYCPNSAHLIAHLQMMPDTRARCAWNRVRYAVAHIGRYFSWRFPDDPALHYALANVGGQETVCNMDTDERPHTERRFIQHYLDGLARGVRWGDEDVPLSFLGEADQTNALNGLPSEGPIEVVPKPRIAVPDGPKALPQREVEEGPYVPCPPELSASIRALFGGMPSVEQTEAMDREAEAESRNRIREQYHNLVGASPEEPA